MPRILVDVSSLLWTAYHTGKDVENGYEVEFEEKKVWVNSAHHTYDVAIDTLVAALRRFNATPSDIVLVVEGARNKALRVSKLPEYKAQRGGRPDEVYAVFNEAKVMVTDAMKRVGATVVTQDGVEADDIIAYLVEKLDGALVIMSNDGDLSALLRPMLIKKSAAVGMTDISTAADVVSQYSVIQYRNGQVLTENPYGPFAPKYVTLYKALVGDSSDNIKGAPGFGDGAFLKMLAAFGEGALGALVGMIERDTLHELEEDVAEFKPFRKIIDAAGSVKASYFVAQLHPEWVNTKRQPLVHDTAPPAEGVENRLTGFAKRESDIEATLFPPAPPAFDGVKKHCVFDCELIGDKKPVFLVCTKIIETGEHKSFWWPKDMDALRVELERQDLTWISFNGIGFDTPIISAALDGRDPSTLKEIAHEIIEQGARPWDVSRNYQFDLVKFDHIDLIETAPGVKISLKTYAGRMAYPTMQDMPFPHDQDLTEAQLPEVETYCRNDLGVTEALFNALRAEINLRIEMSAEYDIDLRSKSDAQVAEAVLRKMASIPRNDNPIPKTVKYKAPGFIQTDSKIVNDLIEKLEAHDFRINPGNGSPEAPDFLKDPMVLGHGEYQCGVGGLHSTHDVKKFVVAEGGYMISDIDVASYYPNIMLKAGLIPRIENGQKFIDSYRQIYDMRMEAKRAGNKQIANSLKIALNGTFGKLGSMFSSFYSPDLMLAVTITGQLNLLCLIHEIEKVGGCMIVSANTDGIMVLYPEHKRDEFIGKVIENAKRTGFEYEETRYAKVALANVNNYVAMTSADAPVIVSPDGTVTEGRGAFGKFKTKGLMASNRPEKNPLYLMKSPTMEVVSEMVCDYLRDGTLPEESIKRHNEMRDFVSIRAVKGGGVQHIAQAEVDDWVLVEDHDSAKNVWHSPSTGKKATRKSRPAPIVKGEGGNPFGRVARWYMTTDKSLPPITYVGSGNTVPKTQGARLCMTLPSQLPDDLDFDWYVKEAYEMMGDLGIEL